jgi:RNA polymerase sigma factor (sigma-70 family)
MKTTTEIMHQNLGLVHKLSYRYQRTGISRKDLVQEGALGLHRAIVKYDPSKGVKLSTYAYPWIRSYMSRYVQKTRKAMDYLPVAEVYNPEPESESLNEVEDLMACLSHGERAILSYLYINNLTVDQVAQTLDIAPTQVRRYQQRAIEKMRQCRLK